LHRIIALVFAATFLLAAVIVEPSSAGVGVENTWVQKTPMPTARSHLGVAVVNGKIYAIGGDSPVNEEYDPATNNWTTKAPMPTPLYNFAIAVYKDKIYCMGSGVNEVYNPQTDTWENKTAMPTERKGLQANVLIDKIYLVGGSVPSNDYPWYTETNINEVYDPQTDTWTTKAPLLNATDYYTSAVFNGKLYVFGGVAENQSRQLLEHMTQIYDPQTNSWSYGAPSPIITGYAQAGVTMGVNAPPKIYIFDAGDLQLPSAQSYDPVTNTWMTGIAEPTSRGALGLVVVDDLIYAIGGITMSEDIFGHTTNTLFDLNEVFTPFGYGTVHVTPSPTPVQSEPPQPTASATPIANDEQLQASAIVAVAVAVAVVVCAGLAVYLRKRHR
jgi:hypothetical protein